MRSNKILNAGRNFRGTIFRRRSKDFTPSGIVKKTSKLIPISTLEAEISHGTKELVSNRRVKGIISRYYSVM